MNRLIRNFMALAAAAAVALATVLLVGPAAVGLGAEIPIGPNTGFGGYVDHQTVLTEAYIWSTLTGSPADAYANREIEFPNGMPAEITRAISYHDAATGEPALAFNLAGSGPLNFTVQLRAVQEGISVSSNPTEIYFSNAGWRPSSGPLPSGTVADWSWTAPLATISMQSLWGPELSGSSAPGTSYIQCLTAPFTSSTDGPASGVRSGSLGGVDFTSAPTYMGELSGVGQVVNQPWYARMIGPGIGDGQSTAAFAAGVVGKHLTSVGRTVEIDVAAACPDLNLTGQIYILGADPLTGSAGVENRSGITTVKSYLARGQPAAPGAQTASTDDLIATPTPSGSIIFEFRNLPIPNTPGAAAVRVQALTLAGTQVSLHIGFSYDSTSTSAVIEPPSVNPPFRADTGVELTSAPAIPIILLTLAMLLAASAVVLNRRRVAKSPE